MARDKDTLLSEVNKSYNIYTDTPVVNLAVGGQNGYRTEFGYFHANADYIRRNLIVKLIQAPTGFQLLPPDRAREMVNSLKALVELHAQSWTGFNATKNVASEQSPVGGAGEMQHTPSNVTRDVSKPTLMLPEKYGLAANSFFDFWIDMFIMNEDTKVPNIVTEAGAGELTDHLPDTYSMTILAWEPCAAFRRVNRAWLISNMYPNTAGEYTGRRDKTQDGDKVEMQIEFTGLAQIGLGVKRFAQSYHDAMLVTNTNSSIAPSFVTEIDKEILASQYGYSELMEEGSNKAITP